MRFTSPVGWARFAWQSDYGQFYLMDIGDPDVVIPTDITPEMERRSLFAPPSGIVIYTAGCLQQHIQISIFDEEPDHSPTEPMSGKPWTRVETAAIVFPSRSFTISSPSHPTPLPSGPVFLLDAADVSARISWMEFEGERDDSLPVEPDVIEIALWPQRARGPA